MCVADMPCEHNMWVRLRMEPSEETEQCLLECIMCEVRWRVVLYNYEKCRDFYHGKCDLGGKCPSPHVYHPKFAPVVKEFGPMPLRQLVKLQRRATRAKQQQKQQQQQQPSSQQQQLQDQLASGEQERVVEADASSRTGSEASNEPTASAVDSDEASEASSYRYNPYAERDVKVWC